MTLRTLLRRSAAITALTALTLTNSPALGADALFTSAAGFNAAAGPLLTDSFEALAGRSRQAAPLSTDLALITPLTANLGVQTGANSPDDGFGAQATDGTRYLSVYLANQPTGTLRFDLARPSTAFAVDLSDLGEVAGSGLVLRTDTGFYASGVQALSFASAQGNGNTLFVGLTQFTPFSQVFITVDGVDEAYGVDQLRVSAVPEPATALLWLAGLGALGAWRDLARRSQAMDRRPAPSDRARV